MKFITFAELEDLELREDVKEVEFNGLSGQDGSSGWHTVYYQNGSEEDLYTVRNINGLEWAAVKSELENYITVDKDNVGDNGSCIVDFNGKYGDYSINGKIIDDELIIDDDELIYFNH